jgi:hypothetical protein
MYIHSHQPGEWFSNTLDALDTPRPEGAGILVSQLLLAFAGLTTNRGKGYNSTSVTLGMPS